MAVTNEEIQQWFKANPNASDTDIYNAMQTNKVDQTQLNTAMGFNPEEVGIRYTREQNAANALKAATPPITAPVTGGLQTVNTTTPPPVTGALQTATTPTYANFTDDGRPIDHSLVSLSEYQNARGQPHTDYKGLVYDAGGGSRIQTPQGERYYTPYAAQPKKEELDWLMAQPTDAQLNKLSPMERSNALESWQMSRPGYVNPMDYRTYEDYAGAANIQSGKDAGNDLTSRANFYGLTPENYMNVLSGDMTKPMGANQSVYGAKLLSPIEQRAAETARGQGISTMSTKTAELAKKNPDIFNTASQKFRNYLATTYPGTLEYQSVLSGPMKYSSTGVTAPVITNTSSMYILDPRTKQIIKNPNYKPIGGLPANKG